MFWRPLGRDYNSATVLDLRRVVKRREVGGGYGGYSGCNSFCFWFFIFYFLLAR
jgi:hypothetical protein